MNSSRDNIWSVGLVVGVLLSLFLLAVTIKEFKSIGYVGRNPQMMNTITVEGVGEVVAIPDVARFTFTVSETAKTVAEAQQLATDKSNKALAAVRESGVADKDIQTTSYNINPRYEYENGLCSGVYCRPGKNVLTGYEVSQSIEVKVRDLSKAGELFTAIGSLGVQNVNSLAFDIDNPDSIKAEARAQAIEKAQAKAKVLAETLGVKIVRVSGFYENNMTPFFGKGGVMMDAAVSSAVPRAPEVPVGETKITTTVSITYEIK